MCCKNLLEKIKNISIREAAVMKVGVFAFTLMVAKFWPAILSLSWGWYLTIFLLAYAYIVYVLFFRK
ncbi:MAG: hypothetical protein HGA80_07160 [Candidatus Omnitrophica bacterium]|nr:hypothetical protein [Candidatus Omnitrophota bacterium]